jgi:hypothetical protein
MFITYSNKFPSVKINVFTAGERFEFAAAGEINRADKPTGTTAG